MKILILNESRLCGRVNISSSKISNLENAPCRMIQSLLDKWLYTESGELVSPKSISKYDLSRALYGKIRPDSPIFTLLHFKKTAADDIDDLKKTIPKEKLDAYFENELKQRFGISSDDLKARYGGAARTLETAEETELPFPSHNVKSWEALKKHAAEMLVYANPVKYDLKVRSIRVSNRPLEVGAYLRDMYRHEGIHRFKYACQLCHETCSNIEATEIFLQPEAELDPVNLCLCPNCAAAYRKIRANSGIMYNVRKAFLTKKDNEIQSGDYVAIKIDPDTELWFTQTHFAEIRELLRLAEEVKNAKLNPPVPDKTDDKNEKSGLSVYDSYIGKVLRRQDGFVGKVIKIILVQQSPYLVVRLMKGPKAGTETQIELAFLLKNKNVYTVWDY